MYLGFFELSHRPFASSPDTACYFRSQTHEIALAQLRESIHEGDGIAVVVGPPGSGKTLVCHLLLDSLDPSQSSVFVTNTHSRSVESLLQTMLHDLSLPYEGLNEQQLRLSLTDFLMERFSQGGRTLLFLDEAQHLSARQLEEIRLLTNLEGKSGKAMQVILFGQHSLVEKLSRPEAEAFRSRIDVVANLEPFDADQTVDYIRALVAYAGGSCESIFTADALSEICERSEGTPRRINQLARRALSIAYLEESATVDASHVAEADRRLSLPESIAQLHHPEPAIAEKEIESTSALEPIDLAETPTFVEVGAGLPASSNIDRRPMLDLRSREEPTIIDPEHAQESVENSQGSERRRGFSRLRQLYAR